MARAAAILGIAVVAAGCAADPPAEPALLYIGEALIDPEPARAGDPPIGGLSSLARGRGGGYYSVSDDRGQRGPARYYELSIDLSDGSLEQADVSISDYRPLLDTGSEPLEPLTYDLEGLVGYGAAFFVSSEGDADAGIAPFVAVFGADGRLIERLALPPGFAPSDSDGTGVRNNLAFESLGITPDGRYLFTATENALRQDGPVATPTNGARARILRFNRDLGGFDAQYAYDLDPVHTAPPGDGLAVTGVVELIALAGDHLLTLERSFVADADEEHSIKLFEVCLGAATDVLTLPSLLDADNVVPAAKRLVTDLAELVPRIDNIEGMTFGPELPSGSQSLVVVSDNNFAPERQVTQVLAFELTANAIRGCETR